MSLPVITSAQIAQNITAQLEGSFGQTIPIFAKAFARVTAKAIAGVVVILYKYQGFIALQKFIRWASMDETTINGKVVRPLVEWGRLIGVGDPLAATPAEIIISVTVLNQVDTLPAYTKLIRSESGVVYEVAYSVALDASIIQATIRPTSDQNGGDGSGSIGNLQVGDVVTFAQTPGSIGRDAVVTSITVTGVDAEEIETYRARIVSRFQSQPQGGAYADYRVWGMSVPGIVNVYPYAGSPGCVDVYSEATVASSGNDDGVPTQAQLDAVWLAIQSDEDSLTSELANRRPVNSAVATYPIYRTPFDVEVNNLTPDTPEIEQQIEDALTEYFLTREPYIEGLTVRPTRNLITLASVSGTVQDIIEANGASASSVVMREYGGIITARSLARGEKAKLGSVTYS